MEREEWLWFYHRKEKDDEVMEMLVVRIPIERGERGVFEVFFFTTMKGWFFGERPIEK